VSNGQMPDDSHRWAIAIVHGLTLVGRLTERLGADRTGQWTMSPVYSLQPQMGQDGRGGLQIGHVAVPLCLLASWTEIVLPDGCIVKDLHELSATERRAIMGAVAQAAKLAESMRAAQAGVVLAPAGAKLPPLISK
jgi:hypothetical protein